MSTIDGRNARYHRLHAALIETCRAAMREGIFAPAMELVCTSARCSVRSGYQHFRGLEALHAEAIADETVRRAVLLHATSSDTSCLDWPAELQAAVIHAVVFGRPIESANANHPSQNKGAEHGQEKASDFTR